MPRQEEASDTTGLEGSYGFLPAEELVPLKHSVPDQPAWSDEGFGLKICELGEDDDVPKAVADVNVGREGAICFSIIQGEFGRSPDDDDPGRRRKPPRARVYSMSKDIARRARLRPLKLEVRLPR